MFSLLHETPEPLGFYDTELKDNLMLGAAFKNYAFGAENLEYFIEILSTSAVNPVNILYRQAVLKDFQSNPALLDAMESAFHGIDKAYNSRFQGRGNPSLSAFTLAEVIKLITDAANNLLPFDPESSALQAVIRRLREISSNPAAREITEICNVFDGMDAWPVYNLDIALDESGRIDGFTLFEPRGTPPSQDVKRDDSQNLSPQTIAPNPKSLLQNLRSIAKSTTNSFSRGAKQAETETDPLKIDPLTFNQVGEKYLQAALHDIADVCLRIKRNLLAEFSQIKKHLSFYRIAATYCTKITEAGYPLVYPKISTSSSGFGQIKIKELRDLLLAQRAQSPKAVKPHDINLSPNTQGLLIRGENNAGKTVFLRSLGMAQVLAQAGLPILAASAEIPVKSGVYTLFSAAEKELEQGNIAGRFEQEARVLASFLDGIQPNSLVLMNEIFQSTAYDEGASGLYVILKAMSHIKCQWVLVTFLDKLFEVYEDEPVAMGVMHSGHEFVMK